MTRGMRMMMMQERDRDMRRNEDMRYDRYDAYDRGYMEDVYDDYDEYERGGRGMPPYGAESRRYRDERGRYTDRPGRRAEMYGPRSGYARYMEDEDERKVTVDNPIGFRMNRDDMIGPDGRQREHGGIIPMHRYDKETDMEPMSREAARKWVEEMPGHTWTEEQARALAKARGMDDKEMLPAYWAVLNAVYTDFEKVARAHGVHKPDFYADLAKAWICDEDAVENKPVMYYKYIVKHD